MKLLFEVTLEQESHQSGVTSASVRPITALRLTVWRGVCLVPGHIPYPGKGLDCSSHTRSSDQAWLPGTFLKYCVTDLNVSTNLRRVNSIVTSGSHLSLKTENKYKPQLSQVNQVVFFSFCAVFWSFGIFFSILFYLLNVGFHFFVTFLGLL